MADDAPPPGSLERALREARDEAQMLRLLADNVPVLMALYEARTFHCRFANEAYARTFGHTAGSVLGRTFADVIGDAAARQIQPYVDQVMQRGEAVRYERQMQGADGRPHWLEVNLLPQFAPGQANGDVIGAFVMINDISERRVAEAALRESEERLDKFMQATVEGILFHRGGIITDANPPLCELVGYRLEELVGRTALDFVAEDMRPKVNGVMLAGQELRYESAILHRSGERIPVEFIVRTLERQGERLRMTIIRDMREHLAAQARIHHLAHHDPLTQLLNRAAFMERMQARLDDAHVPPRPLALLFIDLDNFKRVNDSLGHLEGDKVLGTVADRVSACLRSTCLLYTSPSPRD